MSDMVVFVSRLERVAVKLARLLSSATSNDLRPDSERVIERWRAHLEDKR